MAGYRRLSVSAASTGESLVVETEGKVLVLDIRTAITAEDATAGVSGMGGNAVAVAETPVMLQVRAPPIPARSGTYAATKLPSPNLREASG